MRHADLDHRSLEMHQAISKMIRADPGLIAVARKTLNAWLLDCSDNVKPYLLAWKTLLDGDVETCISVMEEETEWATAMRQSSPFAGMLSNYQRFEILRKHTDRERNRAPLAIGTLDPSRDSRH